jgi:hypothetical protein
MPVLRSDGPTSSLEVDFSLALLSVLESAKKDSAQFRHMVYELARVQLEREARKEKQDGTSSVKVCEMPRLMMAFEAAIAHVERFSCEQEKAHCSPADVRGLHSPDCAAEAALDQPDQLYQSSQAAQARTPHESYRPYELAFYRRVPGEGDDVLRPQLVERNSGSVIDQSWDTRDARGFGGGPRRPARNDTWSRATLRVRGFVVGFAVLLSSLLAYALFKSTSEMAPPARTSVVHVRRPAVAKTETTKSGTMLLAAAAPILLQQSSEVPISDKSTRSEGPSWPLPSVYGIYAVSGGKLIELDPLVGRVPDKVFMSSPISTPSRTQLADPRVEFIVFRRDVANSAPDRVPVRVIAKIRQSLKFARTGKAETAKLDDVWTVRNISYDFRVAPMKENPEMLLLRPENPDFAFSPGRYALVLKGAAYDFTVSGKITETAHCLERTEAANGTFYSECKTLD